MNRLPEMRRRMIEIVQKIGKGHLGTSLSSLPIILAIRDRMKENDIFISSKGHDALAQYIVLQDAGILDDGAVETFRRSGGLPSHPTIDVPGISANTGSLGMGLSKALGFALGQDRRVYCLLGDGEMMEGQNYEAMLAISKFNVDNITVVVDANDFSQDGPAALFGFEIRNMFDAAGWKAFILTKHHDFYDFQNALAAASLNNQPTAIIYETTKGKGASFQGTWQSHAGPPRVDYSIQHPSYIEFGRSIETLMANYDDVILCGADTLRDLNCYHLKEKFPERVFDFGIAEQNMVSFASARALMGQVPIVATYACFLRRAFEQIYNQTTEDTQVIYVGSMAGPLEEGGPGISHQSLDDGEYMQGLLIPTLEVRPSEAIDIDKKLNRLFRLDCVSYLRILHHEPI